MDPRCKVAILMGKTRTDGPVRARRVPLSTLQYFKHVYRAARSAFPVVFGIPSIA
jgi:hypothetical protein